MKLLVDTHCFNDSTGEYCPKVVIGDHDEVLIGVSAVKYIKQLHILMENLENNCTDTAKEDLEEFLSLRGDYLYFVIRGGQT